MQYKRCSYKSGARSPCVCNASSYIDLQQPLLQLRNWCIYKCGEGLIKVFVRHDINLESLYWLRPPWSNVLFLSYYLSNNPLLSSLLLSLSSNLHTYVILQHFSTVAMHIVIHIVAGVMLSISRSSLDCNSTTFSQIQSPGFALDKDICGRNIVLLLPILCYEKCTTDVHLKL